MREKEQTAMKKDPSMEQTAAGLSTTRGITGDLALSERERIHLKDLAKKVRELASRPIEEEKKKLWTTHNDLGETRPLVFCDPENGWNEIIPQNRILCEKPLYRVWEMALRKEIFWAEEMQDDRVIEPYFNVPYNYRDTGWGLESEKIGGEEGGSYTWHAPIQDYEKDFPQLKAPQIVIDADMTKRIVGIAEDLFGDILTVRLRGVWWWTLGMTWEFITLRGLENFMLDMYDRPEWVHRMMGFLQDAHMQKLDFLESNGLLSLNTEGTYVGSGGFGWTKQLPQVGFDPDAVRTADMWGFCESQETVGVAPDMFGEFIFPYQKKILERFGLNCYGCCEPLDSRWHIIQHIPRLRRVSVSAWTNWAAMAELLGSSYIMSLKPNPSALAVPAIDEEAIRQHLRSELKHMKRCRVEIIMKDNHTLGNNPQNAVRWCRIAKEEADNL